MPRNLPPAFFAPYRNNFKIQKTNLSPQSSKTDHTTLSSLLVTTQTSSQIQLIILIFYLGKDYY